MCIRDSFQIVDPDDLLLNGLGAAEVFKFLHHLAQQGSTVDNQPEELLQLRPQRTDIIHIHPQQNILDLVGNIIDLGREICDVLPFNGSDKLPHQLIIQIMIGQIRRMLDLMHLIQLCRQLLGTESGQTILQFPCGLRGVIHQLGEQFEIIEIGRAHV